MKDPKVLAVKDVEKSFLILNDSSLLEPRDPKMPEGVRVVLAKSSTGSSYRVVTSDLGPFGDKLGAQILVSVLSPWQAAYPLQPSGGVLALEYVREKFGRGNGIYYGDLWAITKTIAYALGRTPFTHLLEGEDDE